MRDGRGHAAVHRELLGFDQQPLKPLAVGDVAGNFGGADDAARLVANRRDRDRDLNALAILADVLQFVFLLLAGQPFLQPAAHRRPLRFGRQQLVAHCPQQFGPRVAGQALDP